MVSLQLLDLKSSDDHLGGIAKVCHHLHPHNLSSDHRQCNGDVNDHLIRALGENWRGPRLFSWLFTPRLIEMPLSQKTWHSTSRRKRSSMPNRSTTKLLIKHILHHYWQVRDFALNTTFTGGVTALVSAHFLSFFFTQLMLLLLFLSLNYFGGTP